MTSINNGVTFFCSEKFYEEFDNNEIGRAFAKQRLSFHLITRRSILDEAPVMIRQDHLYSSGTVTSIDSVDKMKSKTLPLCGFDLYRKARQ